MGTEPHVFLQKELKITGAHKIGAAISGPGSPEGENLVKSWHVPGCLRPSGPLRLRVQALSSTRLRIAAYLVICRGFRHYSTTIGRQGWPFTLRSGSAEITAVAFTACGGWQFF